VATATDANGSPTIAHSDVVTNLCGSALRITRTWTAVDACGNHQHQQPDHQRG
jgi:hypothetical protein